MIVIFRIGIEILEAFKLQSVFLRIIVDRRFDGLFGQNRTVNLDGRKTSQGFQDIGVGHLQRFFTGLSDDHIGSDAGRGDS